MNPIEIRLATIIDLETLRKLSIQTFTETFESVNTAENLANYIEKSFNKKQLTTEMLNFNSAFYIAYSNEEPIGYIKINSNEAQTEPIDINALEIHRIYVLNPFYGKSIGQLLLQKAIDIARNNNSSMIWLGVWEENKRALQFYNKHGFVIFDKHIFRLGNDEQNDLLMKIKIQ